MRHSGTVRTGTLSFGNSPRGPVRLTYMESARFEKNGITFGDTIYSMFCDIRFSGSVGLVTQECFKFGVTYPDS
jgi:hypothetical protein